MQCLKQLKDTFYIIDVTKNNKEFHATCDDFPGIIETGTSDTDAINKFMDRIKRELNINELPTNGSE